MTSCFRSMLLLMICAALWSCQNSATGPGPSLVTDTGSDEMSADAVPTHTSLQDGLPSPPARVVGIQCTDPYGNDLGVWGSRSYHGVTAYPNPTTGGVKCGFTLKEFATLTIFIESAFGPGQPEPQPPNNGITGVDLPVVQRMGVAAFSDAYEPGQITLFWDGRDAEGHDVRSGFYRVYVLDNVRGNVGWCDVLIVRAPGDLPQDMPHQFTQ